MRIIIFFLILIISQITIAQNTDTLKRKETYKTVAPRVGIGCHNFLNCEFGVSALVISNRPLQWGAASLYSTYVLQQSNWNSSFNINGFKIGAQSSWAIFMWGIEWKSLNYKSDFFNYLSFKFGISWLDVINVEYLINVLEISSNYPLQTKHQVGINFSLNRKIYNNIWKN